MILLGIFADYFLCIIYMAKKCIPGVFCIENMTLGILMILFIVLAYMYYIFIVKVSEKNDKQIVIYQNMLPPQSSPVVSRPNVILDSYGPPLINPNPVGIPVNIETRGLNTDYTQMGILTRGNGSDMILPLMGRRLMSGLDKWQYYTISNTGNMNTKLPISVKGRSCSGEYGCDSIVNGDMVYVEGYNDMFRVTIYESGKFNYIPYI
jgi:hypothetical protein